MKNWNDKKLILREKITNGKTSKMNCDLCDKNKFKSLFKKKGYSITKCKYCGLVTVDPFPTDEELAKLYDEEYFEGGKNKKGYSNYKEGIKNYFDYVTKEPYIQKRINYLKQFSKGGRLLDVGCAHGFFLKAIREEGWDVTGIDISKYASDFGKKEFNLNIINKSLEDAKFVSNHFDVVTIWSFLDHCTTPMNVFKEINRILKPGGILAFNISNVDSFRAMINASNWRPIRPPEHLYYFSINTSNKYLSRTGFGKTTYFGKGEIGIKHVLQNPDLNMNGETVKFDFSFLQWLKLYSWALICYLSLKTGIDNYTIGSNLDVYTHNIKNEQ